MIAGEKRRLHKLALLFRLFGLSMSASGILEQLRAKGRK